MRFETDLRDGVHVVRLEGRFVTGSERELAQVKQQLQELGATRVVLDFRQVPYVDSTGLAFIVELHKALKQRGGQAVIVQSSPRIQEVLNLTRIADVVPVYDGMERAEAALRAVVLC
jgi:anti-sigma B factor antagonist